MLKNDLTEPALLEISGYAQIEHNPEKSRCERQKLPSYCREDEQLHSVIRGFRFHPGVFATGSNNARKVWHTS